MRIGISKLLFIASLIINLAPCAFAVPNIVIKEAWIRGGFRQQDLLLQIT